MNDKFLNMLNIKNKLSRSISMPDFSNIYNNITYVNSDTKLNKLIFSPCKKINSIKLSSSFYIADNISFSSFEYNSNIVQNNKLVEQCKQCNCNMNIIKNIYNNIYCSYYCYKKSRLDLKGFYHIRCAKCNKKFKTINKYTDYCSDICFNLIFYK